MPNVDFNIVIVPELPLLASVVDGSTVIIPDYGSEAANRSAALAALSAVSRTIHPEIVQGLAELHHK